MVTGILLVLSTIITANYLWLIRSFNIGLKQLKRKSRRYNKNKAAKVEINKHWKVSVVIAARDEEDKIGDCLNDLNEQDYPGTLYQVIVINDQSDDKTAHIVKEYRKIARFDLILLDTEESGGKKAAISLGLRYASGEIILTTDADCRLSTSWISSFIKRFQQSTARFITGPVMLKPQNRLFSKIQCLEFNALMASTAGSIGIKKPIMCNAANMGFKKSVLDDLKNFNASGSLLKNSIASGDDIFLMHRIKQVLGSSSIDFIDTPEATVYTYPNESISDFIQQRIRWVSKSSHYTDGYLIYTSLSVFLINFFILLLVAISLVDLTAKPYHNPGDYLSMATGMLVAKCLIDFSILFKYTGRFGQRGLLCLIPLTEIFVVLYTSMVGIGGNLLGFKWKNRKYSK